MLTDKDGVREEVDLKAPGKRAKAKEPGPGGSELDEVLDDLGKVLDADPDEGVRDWLRRRRAA